MEKSRLFSRDDFLSFTFVALRRTHHICVANISLRSNTTCPKWANITVGDTTAPTRLGAASFIIFLSLGINYKLNHDVMKAGYEYNLGLSQRGGSVITALMDTKNIKEALEMIDKERASVDKEIQNPMYNDSEYLIKLEMDSQALDLLEAVCYMRQGKYFKAKKLLKNIVMANGYYSKEAKNLIDSI